MQYLKPNFTLPASDGKITQAEWDRIFSVSSTPVVQPDPYVELAEKPETAYGNLLPE